MEINKTKPVLVEEILAEKPVPHYLTGEAIVSNDKLSLEATAIFPSSDQSIGQRGHVNVAHYLFGAWNAAHVLAEINGFEDTLSIDGSWKAHKISKPDQPMKLNFEIIDPVVKGRTVRGVLKAVYSVGGDVYAEFNSSFVALKKIQNQV